MLYGRLKKRAVLVLEELQAWDEQELWYRTVMTGGKQVNAL